MGLSGINLLSEKLPERFGEAMKKKKCQQYMNGEWWFLQDKSVLLITQMSKKENKKVIQHSFLIPDLATSTSFCSQARNETPK